MTDRDVFDSDGGLINVLIVDVEGDSIATVRSVVNPDKLGRLGLTRSAAPRSTRTI